MVQAQKLDNLNNTKRMTVFISYRRIDSEEVVGRIYDRLVPRTFDTRAIFRDICSIPPLVVILERLSLTEWVGVESF